MNDKPSIRISHDLEVKEPKQEGAYPIPDSDWKYLRNKVLRIEVPPLFFLTIGSILLGVAGSGVVAICSLTNDIIKIEPNLNTKLWAIVATSSISGILSLIFAYLRRRNISCSKDDVVAEMDHLTEKYKE